MATSIEYQYCFTQRNQLEILFHLYSLTPIATLSDSNSHPISWVPLCLTFIPWIPLLGQMLTIHHNWVIHSDSNDPFFFLPIWSFEQSRIHNLQNDPWPGNSQAHWHISLLVMSRAHQTCTCVHTYNHLNQELFPLHTFLIIIIGDMPAIVYIMEMKGHIEKCPCRACWVTGKQDCNNYQNQVHYSVHIQTVTIKIDTIFKLSWTILVHTSHFMT